MFFSDIRRIMFGWIPAIDLLIYRFLSQKNVDPKKFEYLKRLVDTFQTPPLDTLFIPSRHPVLIQQAQNRQFPDSIQTPQRQTPNFSLLGCIEYLFSTRVGGCHCLSVPVA